MDRLLTAGVNQTIATHPSHGSRGLTLSLNHLIRGQSLTQIHITASYLGTLHCRIEIDLYGQPSMDKLFSYLSLNESRQESMLSDP